MLDEIRNGFETAYIDGSVASNELFRPQFVSNNYREGKKVISSIEDELLLCDEFKISVAASPHFYRLLRNLKSEESRVRFSPQII